MTSLISCLLPSGATAPLGNRHEIRDVIIAAQASGRPGPLPSNAPWLVENDHSDIVVPDVALQVSTVRLQELPGYNLVPMSSCINLTSLTILHCHVIVLDVLEQCTQLRMLVCKVYFMYCSGFHLIGHVPLMGHVRFWRAT